MKDSKMDDLNKTLAWKQSLVFFGAILLLIISIFLIPFISWLGIILNIAGFALYIFNIVATIKSNQAKNVKTALLIPKFIFLVLFFLGTLYVLVNIFIFV